MVLVVTSWRGGSQDGCHRLDHILGKDVGSYEVGCTLYPVATATRYCAPKQVSESKHTHHITKWAGMSVIHSNGVCSAPESQGDFGVPSG